MGRLRLKASPVQKKNKRDPISTKKLVTAAIPAMHR
jgi:hypothetical protein